MIMVSIALVMAVIVTNIFLRKDGKKRVPRILHAIFLRHTCPAWGPPCTAGRDVTSSALPITVTVTSSLDNHANGQSSRARLSQSGDRLAVPDIELDSLSVLSELDVLNASGGQKCHNCQATFHTTLAASSAARRASNAFFSGRRRRSSNYSHVDGGDFGCCSHTSKSPFEAEVEAEWRRLAAIVDRICFWTFLASSAGLLGALFGTIPSYNIIAE